MRRVEANAKAIELIKNNKAKQDNPLLAQIQRFDSKEIQRKDFESKIEKLNLESKEVEIKLQKQLEQIEFLDESYAELDQHQ